MKRLVLSLVGLTLVVIIASFFLQLNSVSGENMMPGFRTGQIALFLRYLLLSPTPQRSDIILYKQQNNDSDFIGRIVALPNELVRIQNGNIYIDNHAGKWKLIEEYVAKGTKTISDEPGEWIQLKEFEYLVLRDKREGQTIDIKKNIVNKNMIEGKLLW